MKKIVTTSIVALIALGIVLLSWSHFSYLKSLESQGVFEQKLNDEVQEFFQEVSEGSGYVEVAGFPGGSSVYRLGGEIVFVVQSQSDGINGYLSIHLPYDAIADNRGNGEIHSIRSDYDGVIPACFSFHEGGEDNEKLIETTYQLGQNAAFDKAFLGFVAAFDASENKWSNWGGAYRTLSAVGNTLGERTISP